MPPQPEKISMLPQEIHFQLLARGSFPHRDGHWSSAQINSMAGRRSFLGKCLLNVTKFSWQMMVMFTVSGSSWFVEGAILKDAGSLKNARKSLCYAEKSSMIKDQRGFSAASLRGSVWGPTGRSSCLASSPLNQPLHFFFNPLDLHIFGKN